MTPNFFPRSLFIGAAILAIFLVGVRPAAAHQPRLVTSDRVSVAEPEISKAYYGELAGLPEYFSFTADRPFRLFAGPAGSHTGRE